MRWSFYAGSWREGWALPSLAEHQLEGVGRGLPLLDKYDGLLLADEAGLGKSFIAAEIAKRSGCQVEVIVPASLVAQWRATLADFGVRGLVMTHEALLRSPFVPDLSSKRLMIVDEAHAFRNPATRRYDALARRSLAAKLLLVTATPLCNGLADLRALIGLIANDDALRFAGVPSIDLAFERGESAAIDVILRELVIRRDRAVLPLELKFGALKRRVLRHPMAGVQPEIDQLEFPLVGSAPLLRRFLWRRLESSEAALLESIRRQLRFYERALECLAAGGVLKKRDYRRAFGHEEDHQAFQQILFWEVFVPPAMSIEPSAIDREVRRLQHLANVVSSSPQEKRRMLVELCRQEREPMLIFTGSAATARDLAAALPSRTGLVTARETQREAVFAAFQSGEIERLVCTDLAAEGLNLQRAGVVVHYDIPWNPARLDQRNGRAHRIGQAREIVKAIYFLPPDDASGVVGTVSAKNRVRRRTFHTSGPSSAAATLVERTAAEREDTRMALLPPRVAGGAAVIRFLAAASRQRLELPDPLIRRHRAGVERLLFELSDEYLDESRMHDLMALVSPI